MPFAECIVRRYTAVCSPSEMQRPASYKFYIRVIVIRAARNGSAIKHPLPPPPPRGSRRPPGGQPSCPAPRRATPLHNPPLFLAVVLRRSSAVSPENKSKAHNTLPPPPPARTEGIPATSFHIAPVTPIIDLARRIRNVIHITAPRDGAPAAREGRVPFKLSLIKPWIYWAPLDTHTLGHGHSGGRQEGAASVYLCANEGGRGW